MEALTRKKKTENIIVVKKGKTAGTLEIDDHEVHGNPLKQTIRWQLDNSLDLGNFTKFEWVVPAPTSGTFDTPEIAYDGDSLMMGDRNGPTAQKNVRHAYMITVEMEGVPYSSRLNQSETTNLMKDPVIINR